MPLYKRGQSELYRNDILGLDEDLYSEESKILSDTAEESVGGCLFIMFILIGVIGVPLGGWGIPVLIAVGFWWMIETNKEVENNLTGVIKKPKHSVEINTLIERLLRNNSSNQSKSKILQ